MNVRTNYRWSLTAYTFCFDVLLKSIPNKFALINMGASLGIRLKVTIHPAMDRMPLIVTIVGKYSVSIAAIMVKMCL